MKPLILAAATLALAHIAAAVARADPVGQVTVVLLAN